MKKRTAPIPIDAAKRIAKDYGYDQIIVIGRKCGQDGVEHVTTYGRDRVHCDIAASIGNFLKNKVMQYIFKAYGKSQRMTKWTYGDWSQIGPLIDELGADEGSYLTICCPNPDFDGPAYMIEVFGYWTDWQKIRIVGDTLLLCLQSAINTKREVDG